MNREPYRNRNQLTTKYRDINKKIMFFNDIYNNLKGQLPSDLNDAQILTEALKSYKVQN